MSDVRLPELFEVDQDAANTFRAQNQTNQSPVGEDACVYKEAFVKLLFFIFKYI